MRNLIPAMNGWRRLKVLCVLYTCTSILTLTRRQKSTCALYTSAHYTRDFTVIFKQKLNLNNCWMLNCQLHIC